MYRDGIRNLIV